MQGTVCCQPDCCHTLPHLPPDAVVGMSDDSCSSCQQLTELHSRPAERRRGACVGIISTLTLSHDCGVRRKKKVMTAARAADSLPVPAGRLGKPAAALHCCCWSHLLLLCIRHSRETISWLASSNTQCRQHITAVLSAGRMHQPTFKDERPYLIWYLPQPCKVLATPAAALRG
jgi:hypothetical protein